MSIKLYLKYKYTYENAGFCILCNDFKTLKMFNKLSKLFFTKKRHRRQQALPLYPQLPYDVSRHIDANLEHKEGGKLLV